MIARPIGSAKPNATCESMVILLTLCVSDQDLKIFRAPRRVPRRARAAALNMIPTSTGAAKAIGKVMPHLLGKLNGYAMRVPTPDVSVVDLTVNLKKEVTKDEIHAAFNTASAGAFKGLIEVDNDKRVSCDFIGSTYSSTYVPDMTSVVDGKTVKVLAWYDNEWGYSSRLVDMTVLIGTH